MMANPYAKYALAQAALKFFHPLVCNDLLNESGFREEYSLTIDGVIAFDSSGVSVQSSMLFDAIRKVLSEESVEKVVDTNDQEWELKNSSEKRRPPHLSLSRGKQHLIFPPYFVALSADRSMRLRSLDEAVFEANLPDSASDPWRNILTERALRNEEVLAFHREFLDTPVKKARSINGEILGGQINISSLIPPSRRYFERLVGTYDGSTSIAEYAAGSGKTLFAQLSAWRSYDGFLFSLLLSSHSSMTDEINVDPLDTEDLVRAFDFLDKHGDRISQLGAIDVGLRVLPERPEIEQAIIRLIEQIRDDNVDGQESGFKLLSALFSFVDGELSRTKLLPSEPPFYRKLAALSQAALIHRQILNSNVDVDHFGEWAFLNRGWQHYMQSLVDMRLEPRWNPNFSTALQMKAEFFGRIMNTAEKCMENIKDSELLELILGTNARSLRSRSDFFYPYLPGPLEGGEEAKRILPADFAKTIEAQLSEDRLAPSSFIALVNSALLFRISEDQAELAARELKRAHHRLLNIEHKYELPAILSGLAMVAAVSRSITLADELRVLVRQYRHDAEFPISLREAIAICLVAAAGRADLNEWREFVGALVTELAFSDLSGSEAEQLSSDVRYLCHAVPELWSSCSRADAALAALIDK